MQIHMPDPLRMLGAGVGNVEREAEEVFTENVSVCNIDTLPVLQVANIGGVDSLWLLSSSNLNELDMFSRLDSAIADCFV